MSLSLFVSPENATLRIDKFLSMQFPEYSRSYFQYLIDKACVLINGQAVKKRQALKPLDEVEICFELTPELSLIPEAIPLEILYEDEHLLAINKPVGMVVHPAPGHPSGTFVNALLHHCHTLKIDSLRPGIVHRLDKDTSGVLIAAKTAHAHAQLVSLFSSRQIEKTYLTICLGNPGNVTINAPIKRHPVRRQEMAVIEGGKEAVSICTILNSNAKLSLVSVRLITGRTHQIRVHLKSRGTPVLGDSVYGSPSANTLFGAKRQLLHAHKICFIHPITNSPLEIEAPIPEDMNTFITKKLID
ncbi:MAG: RluA family pseudouridine synthase [Chlamydiota bacterium]